MADNVAHFKYILKNVARAHGKVATFMPKPLFGDNGTGMHVHQSIWKGGENLFYSPDGYALFSQMGLYYIGGLLKHAPALLALLAPTTNSYRRLVPGFEAPVNLAYSQRNRSACARIPMYFSHPASKRVEYRCPDPSCNPYLAFSAMLMAGLDGIINRIDPGEPLDQDIYDLSPEEAAKVQQVPGSLDKVLDALEADHDFLTRGDVFTDDLIHTWLDYKRHGMDAVRLRPHPYEFFLYFDA
jgi:glutamine synthetase